MNDFLLREARWSDCGAMARKVCAGRWLCYSQAGIDMRSQLRLLWGMSLVRKSWFIDGRIAAMGGLTGTLLSRTGKIWMVVAPEAEEHRFAFLREAMGNLDAIARAKRELHVSIAETDGTALRFAQWMGFRENGPPVQIGQSSVFVLPLVMRR